MSGDNIDVMKLLQPNLLSEEELRSVLRARCINIKNMGAMNKEQLLDIFNRVVTPLQQRPPRRTGTQQNCDSPAAVKKPNNCEMNGNGQSAKKIKLDIPTTEYTASTKIILKRKTSDDCELTNNISPPKKVRQRIVWP